MNEEMQKRMITILSGVIAFLVADRIADRYINVPEEPGVKDDIKEALIKGVFRFASTVLASIIVRQILGRVRGN